MIQGGSVKKRIKKQRANLNGDGRGVGRYVGCRMYISKSKVIAE